MQSGINLFMWHRFFPVLKQWDQFAVTALRAFSVKIVGVAKSTIRVKKQRLLDAQINHDPLEIMHLPQTL